MRKNICSKMLGPSNFAFPFPGLERLLPVYTEVEEQMAHLKKSAHIECLSRCQKCCETATWVEASIFEMLPLSIHLWEKGKAESLLEQLTEGEQEGSCILFKQNPSPFSKGGCRYYSFRPLVCRLFGFSAIPDKYGKPKIALCKPMKELNPGIEDRINGMIQEGLEVPILPHFSRRVAFINPNFGQRLHSINQSLRQALGIVGYKMEFQKNSDLKGAGL